MFRRKEDDIAQDLLGGAEHESATHANTAESGAVNGASAAGVATAATPMTATPPQAHTVPTYSRPAADSSRPTAATAPVYRPAGTPAEAPRGRAPEYRPGASASSLPASLTAAAAGFGANDKSQAKAANRRVLTVGNDILLKGEIATCDRLVIEGAVDATLNEVHTVEIAEGGSFKGFAEIEDAEISGVFEGELVVRNRLVVYATGKVRGKITYGEIEIERGGELTGEIKTMAQMTHKAKAGVAPAKGKTPLEAAAA